MKNDRIIPRGTEVAFAVKIQQEGFNMERDDFAVDLLYGMSGKHVRIEKSDMRTELEGRVWLFDVDTTDMIAEVTAVCYYYVPDEEASGGIREMTDRQTLMFVVADSKHPVIDVADDEIDTRNVSYLRVVEGTICDGEIIGRMIADQAVTTDKIADNNVTEDKLADKAVTTDKLADDTITELTTIMDSEPVEGSVKPIQSGGVFEALMDRVIMGDIVGDPAAAWEPGSAEAYIDQRINEQNNLVNTRMNRQDIVIKAYHGNKVVIVDELPESGEEETIYRVPASDHYTDYMWDTSLETPAFSEIATFDFPGIDDVPTSGSEMLVKSGGVYDIIGGDTGVKVEHNGTIYPTGKIYEGTQIGRIAKYTDFIPVRAGDVLYYKGSIGNAYCCVAGYSDANDDSFVKVLVPYGDYDYVPQKFTIPTGVSYILATSRNSSEFHLSTYNLSTLEEDVSALQDSMSDANESIAAINDEIEGLQSDVADNYDAIDALEAELGSRIAYNFPNDSFIDNQGNVWSSPSADESEWAHTDMIEVDPGKDYYYKGRMGGAYYCVVGYPKPEGASTIPCILAGGSAYNEYTKLTIPEGITHIIASSSKIIAPGSTVPQEYGLYASVEGSISESIEELSGRMDDAEDDIAELKGGHYLANEYYGKSVFWMGDSIVQDHDFDDVVVEYFGLIKTAHYEGACLNGAAIALRNNKRSIAQWFHINKNTSSVVDDADVIVVSAGTNDYQYCGDGIAVTFGQLSDADPDTTDKSDTDATKVAAKLNSFYGALGLLCRDLIRRYPDKIIFFTTPIKRNQDNNSDHYELDTRQDTANTLVKYLYNYANAIKEVCAKYSIPVCDLYSESMLNPNMTAQAGYFDNEGTHPNNTGRAIMARRVRGFMKQLA